MGSIFKPKYKDRHGNIKESKVYWIKYYRAGKPYRESSKSTKESDAKRLLKLREGEISQGKLPGIYFDKVTFDELAEAFLADYRINKNKSLRRAKQSVKHLSEFFGGMRVPDITTPLIQAFIERRMQGICKKCKKRTESEDRCSSCGSEKLKSAAANSTINRDLAALKRMLNLGARQTPPKVDRVPFIPTLEEDNVREGFFEPEEFFALRANLPEHLQPVATFAHNLGWRHEEICTLKWPQVDLKQRSVRLEPGTTKNKQARMAYLDDELIAMLRKLWNSERRLKSGLPWVFLNEKGTDRIKRFDKAWKTACKDAGIGKRLFHDLRRTAVRNMVRSGTPERVAMVISGHKTRAVFDRYNIVNEADLKLATQRQAAYLQTAMGKDSGKDTDSDEKRGFNHVR